MFGPLTIRRRYARQWSAGTALTAWLLVLLALGCSLPAAAQSGGEELRAYLDRTDELLDWAAEQVAVSGSDQAREVLARARQIQSRSRELLARGRPLEALATGRRARDAMWHAVRLAREAAGLEERIRLRADRFADQHAQLSERARESGNQRAVDVLEQAREQARRARERHQQGDLQMAWKLLEQADDLMRLAARLLAESVGPERLQADLERTRQLVDEATGRLSGADAPKAAVTLLAEAQETLARAEVAMAGGDSGRALQMASLARRLTQRALALAGENPDAASVERLLTRFDERAAPLAERLRDGGEQNDRRIFDRARDQRDAAARALHDGKIAGALRQVRSAHDLLDQVERGLR